MTVLFDWLKLIAVSKAALQRSLPGQQSTTAFVFIDHKRKTHRLDLHNRRRRWHDVPLYHSSDEGGGIDGDDNKMGPMATRQAPSQFIEPDNYWTLPRLYVGPKRLTQSSIVTLSPEQTHYLTKVMRLFKRRKSADVSDNDDVTSGKECVRLFNGEDGEWLAKVRVPLKPDEEGNKTRKRRPSKHRNELPLEAECLIELRTQTIHDVCRPWLLCAPLKNQSRMKVMIEKCTELGVGAIILAKSDRMDGSIFLGASSHRNDSENFDAMYGGQDDNFSGLGVEKLRLQAIEASEQCERLSIPCITSDASSMIDVDNDIRDSMLTMKDIVRLWCNDWNRRNGEGRKLLICRERSEQSTDVEPVLNALRDTKNVIFVVGPEGGWSKEEETQFDALCSQYVGKESPIQCVSLGSSVLRAETASVMAVGAWSLVHDL
ncbi:hypothetical protein HJC23_010724 [Cyclotella cryptica]|uniref:16S rRNA (uracil(1498)-N(3))-methyltransferase n=1 Tax=Cyclotella cryptica TaxID=29204 RepID=A0ABD3PI63_9STRA|eukprot:CCRYP_015454-RA/>CCRYP_015454-RA protein AED:0.42 eAED:0.42 QI:0/-1/0/1/-1/1/1/0/430